MAETETDATREPESGSVSEVDNLGDAGPIQPDQSVAGAPDDPDEPGEAGGEGPVQEGRQGPNAVTGNESQER